MNYTFHASFISAHTYCTYTDVKRASQTAENITEEVYGEYGEYGEYALLGETIDYITGMPANIVVIKVITDLLPVQIYPYKARL